MSNIMIYVAGPYSDNPPIRTREAIEVADKLIQLGYLPFVPHLSLVWDMIKPKSYKEWLDLDFKYITKCDAVLRMPGASPGADEEVIFARKINKEVFYSIEDLHFSFNPYV